MADDPKHLLSGYAAELEVFRVAVADTIDSGRLEAKKIPLDIVENG